MAADLQLVLPGLDAAERLNSCGVGGAVHGQKGEGLMTEHLPPSPTIHQRAAPFRGAGQGSMFY